MTLSVLLGIHQPAPVAAAILAPLREVADEIVLAVDQRVDPGVLGAYEALADRLLRVEYCGSVALAWKHRQCSGDWVLRLDADEVPSAALVAALPGLCADEEMRQYWLPTRWVWPDRAHWLDELPWWPDYHNRLVRNDGELWFDGRPHTGAHPAWPARCVEAPLYHLDPILTSEAERAAKVARNVERGPALVAPGGGELNARYYLPERSARLDPAPVPPEDRERIAAVLDAPSAFPARPPRREPVLATRSDFEAAHGGRCLEPAAYQAAIRPLERDHRMLAGETRNVHVAVRNHGTVTWPWGEGRAPEIRVSYHWRHASGAMLIHDGHRTPFPAAVAPDAECIVPVVVTAPPEPGRYLLALDVVHEHARWFDCELRLAFDVEPDAAERAQPRRRWPRELAFRSWIPARPSRRSRSRLRARRFRRPRTRGTPATPSASPARTPPTPSGATATSSSKAARRSSSS